MKNSKMIRIVSSLLILLICTGHMCGSVAETTSKKNIASRIQDAFDKRYEDHDVGNEESKEILSECIEWNFDADVEYVATTEKKILFSNIPWNITVNDFNRNLDSIGIKYRSTYTEYGNTKYSIPLSSTAFGDGRVIPIVSSKYVPTREYWIQPESVYASDLCKVAGHSVSWIYATFYDQYPTRLYEIDIRIASSKIISAEEQYNDLRSKLTYLYGEPYSYFAEDLLTVTNCSVWIGSESTAVYLRRYQFKDRNSESIILCYGLQSSGDTFLMIEEQAISKNEQRKNDALDSIADDYSGL